jgi:glycosyltransferase involved in cell wall biosynthesis
MPGARTCFAQTTDTYWLRRPRFSDGRRHFGARIELPNKDRRCKGRRIPLRQELPDAGWFSRGRIRDEKLQIIAGTAVTRGPHPACTTSDSFDHDLRLNEMPLKLFANEAAAPAPVKTVANGPMDAGSFTSNPKTRVCISLPFARQLLNGSPGYFGGAEVRGVTFVKGLAKHPSLDTHVVVMGDGSIPTTRDDSITMHHRPNVSFFEGHHDSNTRSVWADVNADVYMAFGANEATAELARYCMAANRPLVVSLASDMSFAPFVYENSTEKDPYGVDGRYTWFGMAHAQELIVQTGQQQALVRDRLQRESTLIRNPAPVGTRSAARKAPGHGGRILWIGRVDPNKRPEEALALAAALPHRSMIVVCNNIEAKNPGIIHRLQEQHPNLMLADQVPLADIDDLFRFSDVLVNTSIVEGYPNTFLQAGMHGLPIVSMQVDPDGVLRQFGCGRVANGTREDFVQCVEGLLSDNDAYAAASSASVRLLHERHDAEARIGELAAVLLRVAGN